VPKAPSETSGRNRQVSQRSIDSKLSDRSSGLERIASQSLLPIPNGMVYLELETPRNGQQKDVEPLLGPFGINPLALFQAFIHSKPIATVSASESSTDKSNEESNVRPREAQAANSLSTTSVGLIAMVSAIFFAFSPRGRKAASQTSLKLRSTARMDAPTSIRHAKSKPFLI
jgi:hypothetical protein